MAVSLGVKGSLGDSVTLEPWHDSICAACQPWLRQVGHGARRGQGLRPKLSAGSGWAVEGSRSPASSQAPRSLVSVLGDPGGAGNVQADDL